MQLLFLKIDIVQSDVICLPYSHVAEGKKRMRPAASFETLLSPVSIASTNSGNSSREGSLLFFGRTFARRNATAGMPVHAAAGTTYHLLKNAAEHPMLLLAALGAVPPVADQPLLTVTFVNLAHIFSSTSG